LRGHTLQRLTPTLHTQCLAPFIIPNATHTLSPPSGSYHHRHLSQLRRPRARARITPFFPNSGGLEEKGFGGGQEWKAGQMVGMVGGRLGALPAVEAAGPGQGGGAPWPWRSSDEALVRPRRQEGAAAGARVARDEEEEGGARGE